MLNQNTVNSEVSNSHKYYKKLLILNSKKTILQILRNFSDAIMFHARTQQ